MIRKAFLAFLFALFIPWGYVHAQEDVSAQIKPPASQSYYNAEVVSVAPQESEFTPTGTIVVELKLQNKPRRGETVQALWANDENTSRTFKVNQGSRVIVSCTVLNEEETCEITSQQRTWPLLLLVGLLASVTWWSARGHGLRSLLTIGISLIVILFIIVPLILKGFPPFLLALLGGIIIIVPTIYISHGVNAKSHIALVAIFIAALVISLLSLAFSHMLQLMGMASEESLYLDPSISLRGVLLSAILLGALGVIDDLAVTQVSMVNELHHSNPRLSTLALFQRAMKIGRDHIASVINTLFLAYVGVSLPLLILIQQNDVPLWVAVQQEQIATEVMRTIIGTLGLILVVPLATYLAAYLIFRYPEKFPAEAHHHIH